MNTSGGLLLIDKPAGMSSFDVIRRLRRQTGQRKFGHAGTLDPMATGLLLIMVGAGTKLGPILTGLDKTYQATAVLGAYSSTGDREGQISILSEPPPDPASLDAVRGRFIGSITQTPPAYSAIKINGTRAYRLARSGHAVEMPPRNITVHELTFAYEQPGELTIMTAVSSGTYIRSLADDIAIAAGSRAYLRALRRNSVGPFRCVDAVSIDAINTATLNQQLLQVEAVHARLR